MMSDGFHRFLMYLVVLFLLLLASAVSLFLVAVLGPALYRTVRFLWEFVFDRSWS